MAFDTDSTPIVERITVQIQDTTTGSGIETMTDIGCIVNDVNLARAWANDADTGTENRWCDTGEEVARLADYIAGEETITSSILLEAVLADEAYQYLRKNRRTPFNIRFVLEDAENDVTTETIEYRVIKTSDSLNMRGGRGQTTQFSFDFQAVEVVTESIATEE